MGRSQLPYVDMGALLAQFGGGGHAAAAACMVKQQSGDEVMRELEAALSRLSLKPQRVSDVMSSPALTIAHDATLLALRATLARHVIRGVPVMRDGQLCGMISRRDLERAERAGEVMTLPVSAKMAHEVVTIGPDEPLEAALEAMTRADIGRLPVLDAQDRLIGMISRSDLIRSLYQAELAAP